MFKTLRNLLILLLLLAGVVKLVLWQQANSGLTRQLQRISSLAQVSYSGVSAGYNGAITISKVQVLPLVGSYRFPISAESVTLQTPGLIWMLQRSLGSADEIPESLVITIEGLTLPEQVQTKDQSWFNPLATAPFETFGCGAVTRFTAADYERMGLALLRPIQRARYRYSREDGELELDVLFDNAPLSQIGANLVVKRLNHLVLSGRSSDPIEIVRLDLSYMDSGFLVHRNKFCAQSLSSTPTRFVERHIETVLDWFAKRGVRPAGEMVGLYRRLITNGGEFLLHNGTVLIIGLEELATLAPDDLIARLKMQAQLDELAPRPLKLQWLDSEDTTLADDAAGLPVFESAAELGGGPPDEVDTRSDAEIALTELRALFRTPEEPAQVVEEIPIANQPEAVESDAPDPVLGLVSRLPRPGEIERLPPPVARSSKYQAIAYDDLAIHIGRRVRLVTLLGKRHVGLVEAVDENDVQLRVNLTSGHVLYAIPKNNLREILLLKR